MIKRSSPAAKHQPLVDAQLLPDLLDIVHQSPRRVVLQARLRRRLAGAPLIKEHDAERFWVKATRVERVAAASLSLSSLSASRFQMDENDNLQAVNAALVKHDRV